MAKVHIGKGGIVRRCVAKPGNCPYGGAEAHWENAEDARFVADDVNRQLANMSGFGVAKSGDYVVPNKYTELAILRMANLEANLEKLESYTKKARAKVLKELQSKNIKTLDTEQIRATWVYAGTRKGIDSEMFYADTSIDHNQYTSESAVKEHLRYENESPKTNKWVKENGETLPEFKFEIKNENGELTLSTDVQKSISDLKDLENSLREAKQSNKDLRNGLQKLMIDNNVSDLRVGRIKLSNIGETTRTNVNTKALKEDGLYEKYSKETITSDSLRLKFKEYKIEDRLVN